MYLTGQLYKSLVLAGNLKVEKKKNSRIRSIHYNMCMLTSLNIYFKDIG